MMQQDIFIKFIRDDDVTTKVHDGSHVEEHVV